MLPKGGLAPYNHGAIIVAGVGNEEGTTEWYDSETKSWSVRNANPSFSRKFYFSTVGLQGAVYQVGFPLGDFRFKCPILNSCPKWRKFWTQSPIQRSDGEDGCSGNLDPVFNLVAN